ncbi:MAG: flagellar hook-length control protein FliK [Mangrovicoccus sp.]
MLENLNNILLQGDSGKTNEPPKTKLNSPDEGKNIKFNQLIDNNHHQRKKQTKVEEKQEKIYDAPTNERTTLTESGSHYLGKDSNDPIPLEDEVALKLEEISGESPPSNKIELEAPSLNLPSKIHAMKGIESSKNLPTSQPILTETGRLDTQSFQDSKPIITPPSEQSSGVKLSSFSKELSTENHPSALNSETEKIAIFKKTKATESGKAGNFDTAKASETAHSSTKIDQKGNNLKLGLNSANEKLNHLNNANTINSNDQRVSSSERADKFSSDFFRSPDTRDMQSSKPSEKIDLNSGIPRTPGANSTLPQEKNAFIQSSALKQQTSEKFDVISGLDAFNDEAKVAETEKPNSSLTEIKVENRVVPDRGETTQKITRKEISAQISEAIVRTNGKRIEIQLFPEELGRVSVNLAPKDAGWQVSLSADTSETLETIRRSLEFLEQELNSEGFSNLEFEFRDGEQNDFSDEIISREEDPPVEQLEPQDLRLSSSITNNSDRNHSRIDIRI